MQLKCEKENKKAHKNNNNKKDTFCWIGRAGLKGLTAEGSFPLSKRLIINN